MTWPFSEAFVKNGAPIVKHSSNSTSDLAVFRSIRQKCEPSVKHSSNLTHDLAIRRSIRQKSQPRVIQKRKRNETLRLACQGGGRPAGLEKGDWPSMADAAVLRSMRQKLTAKCDTFVKFEGRCANTHGKTNNSKPDVRNIRQFRHRHFLEPRTESLDP